MKELFNNATRKVLILVAVTMCIAFLYQVFTGRVTLSEANFVQLAFLVLGGFFATKSSPQDPMAGGMK